MSYVQSAGCRKGSGCCAACGDHRALAGFSLPSFVPSPAKIGVAAVGVATALWFLTRR